ncbi:MAG TPA: hypothetical protein VFE45_18620, partial [Coriobacteriia bacterium]|nr:hypothetical protein [Coriobacteriia bacterium]
CHQGQGLRRAAASTWTWTIRGKTLTIFSRPSAEPPREYLDHLVYAEEQMVPGLGCRAGELFET